MIIFNNIIPHPGCGAELLHSLDNVRWRWCRLTGVYNQAGKKRLFSLFPTGKPHLWRKCRVHRTHRRGAVQHHYQRNVRGRGDRQGVRNVVHHSWNTATRQGLKRVLSCSLIRKYSSSMWVVEGKRWSCDCTDSGPNSNCQPSQRLEDSPTGQRTRTHLLSTRWQLRQTHLWRLKADLCQII